MPKKAYVIGNITVKDEGKWSEYRTKVPSTLTPWGAELVFRGERHRIMDGSQPHNDTVVISFPDLASVDSWFNSTAYQALIPLRQQAADIDLISYQAD